MKKLTMIVLTAAVALPLTFAADKPVAKAADSNNTVAATPVAKKKHSRKHKAVKPAMQSKAVKPAPVK